MPQLVVITGPIASGKSTVAGALAGRLRRSGRAVAVLDLDDVVDTIGGFLGLEPARFAQAQVVHGRLVGAWLDEGFDVIAHGPIFLLSEQENLLHAVPARVTPRRVLLLATFDVALERVAGDESRAVSSDPAFLRRSYDHVESLLPALPPSDWTYDTTAVSWQSIVDDLAAALLPGRP